MKTIGYRSVRALLLVAIALAVIVALAACGHNSY